MGENILLRPSHAGRAAPDPAGTGNRPPRVRCGPRAPACASSFSFSGMKVEHVGGGIGDLRLGQRLGAPIRGLLLLRQVDAQQARAPGPSGRACRYRCGSVATRSWCNRAAPAMTPNALTAPRCRSAHNGRSSDHRDRPAAASGWARRSGRARIWTTSAEPSPGDNCTTQSRSRCGLRPSVSVSIATDWV